MGVLITTGTLATASNRVVDRAPSGRLWVMHFASGSVLQFWLSDDNGTTWTKATGDLTGSAQGSFFVDLDGGLNIAYEAGGSGAAGFAYRRGTVVGTTITWSAELLLSGSLTVHDLVSFRHPAGGWSSLAAVRSGDGNNSHMVYWLRAIDTTVSLAGTFDLTPGLTQGGSGFIGAIDFHHTGDGKTVQGGTPHGYVGFVTSLGERRLTKLIWGGTGYTLSTQTITTAGALRAVSFDGLRVMLMQDGATDTKRLIEVDTGNTTQINRGLSADIGTGFITPTMSYDRDGNFYLLATDSGTSDLYRTKWTRATTSWDAAWTLVLAGSLSASN
ncbi:MAG: hypothetical protein ABR609_08720, partial [Acidimicrobiia bacterium]